MSEPALMLFTGLHTKGTMQIHAITSRLAAAQGGKSGFSKAIQTFKDIGNALESGDLPAAKAAFSEFQQYTPRSFGKAKNPMSLRLEALSNALDAGDLKAAQEAYAGIQAQRSAGKGHSVTPPAEPPPADTPSDIVEGDSDVAVPVNDQSQTGTEGSASGTVDSDRGTLDAVA